MYNLSQITHIHLEVTTKCQARCPMCPRRIQGGPLSPFIELVEIDLETFKNWFPLHFLQKLPSISFCGNLGDPIIAKDTLEICQYLRQCNNNIYIQLHTNGSARSLDWWESLAKLDVVVVFGIDGLEDTHSRYRINTSFPTIIENAKHFIAHGGRARWDMLVFDHNKHQVDECRLFSELLGFEKFFSKNTSRFKDGKFNVLDDTGKTIDILYPTEKSISHTNSVKESISESIPNITCKAKELNSIYVSANGNIAPCCWLDFEYIPPPSESRIDFMDKIGIFPNLKSQSLEDIFNSSYFSDIEDLFNSNQCLKECSKQCGKFDKLGAQFES